MKKQVRKKNKELEVPFWLLDGFVGILALVIYNFCIYMLEVIGIKGLVEKTQESMGYFCLSSFIDLGFTITQMTLGLLTVFILSFMLGVIIGHAVRKRRKKQNNNHRKNIKDYK